MLTKKPNSSIVIMPGAESYKSIKSTDVGVFLIHGYGGSPYTMIDYAKKFEAKGYSVCCPRLPGHGTNELDFQNVTMENWLQSIYDHYLEFNKKVKTIYVIGFSMGGILASFLAYMFDIKKLALISTPYDFDKKMKNLKILRKFKKVIKTEKSNTKKYKNQVNYENIYYTKSLYQLYRLIKFYRRFIKKIKSDVIIVQSEKDDAVSFNSPQKIYNKVDSFNKKLQYVKDSNHVIPLDKDSEKVFNLINDFFFAN